MVDICGGSGGSKGGGGGASDNWLSQKESDQTAKQTTAFLRGKSQETIKRYAASTEAQIKSITPETYAKMGPKNYQRLTIEYNTARDMIKKSKK